MRTDCFVNNDWTLFLFEHFNLTESKAQMEAQQKYNELALSQNFNSEHDAIRVRNLYKATRDVITKTQKEKELVKSKQPETTLKIQHTYS